MTSDLNTSVMLPIGELLKHHAKKEPKRPALIIDNEVTTREELDARSNRRARLLSSLGVHQGDLVTIALPNGEVFYETVFAIWKLGAIPNVISPKMAKAEIETVLDLVEPRLVVGLNPSLTRGRNAIAADDHSHDELSSESLIAKVSPNWKAMTSGGSTGRPKVILDAMPGLWSPTKTMLNQRPNEVILNPGPLYHNAPFVGTHYGLFIGNTVVDMKKFDALSALTLIDQFKVNWVNLVPTMMHRIWRLSDEVRERFDLASLKTLYHMAAPCPIWLKEFFIEWLGPDRIFELFAATERQGRTRISGSEWLLKKGSVGRPDSDCRIRIFGENGTECGPREIGEIYFLPSTGVGSTYRYIGSEPRRRGEWETTGDIGWLDEEGYLFIADRRADLIISGGANIFPAEVEAALDKHPDVCSSVVVGLPNEEWGQSVHAIVQVDTSSALTEDSLLTFLSELLTPYKRPKSIEFTNADLRDEAGKVRRSRFKKAKN